MMAIQFLSFVLLLSLSTTTANESPIRRTHAWLARHQAADGHWQFDPPAGAEQAYSEPGTWKSDSAATALALLTLMGGGETPKMKGVRSVHRQAIDSGLNWLIEGQTPKGDLARGGRQPVVSHALATMALAEAFGITGDKRLGEAAQKAVDFIVESQDAKTFGWPAKPGDSPRMSVFVWNVMALKSAKLVGLTVPKAVLENAGKFLDSVQSDSGTKYGETSSNDVSDRATAAGLLSRQLIDSKRDNPALRRGIQRLAATGPSRTDASFNCFATQCLRSSTDSEWIAWNHKVRDRFLELQVKEGAETGSCWNADDVFAGEGGRLFQTTVTCLTVEVYFRYLLLFRYDATEEK